MDHEYQIKSWIKRNESRAGSRGTDQEVDQEEHVLGTIKVENFEM